MTEASIAKVHSAIRWNKPVEEIESAVSDSGVPLATALGAKDPKNGNQCIHIAVQNGHASLVRYLVENKADVNGANNKGQTPLHMSVEYDFYFLSKYLMESGANPKATNAAGHQAIQGLEGTKTGKEAWDQPVTILRAAGDDPSELNQAFEALEAADPGSIDKGSLAQAGMQKKKACKQHWDKDRFVKLMQAL